jgi:hypothetical protein
LASISCDPVETLAAFGSQQGITFPTLSDVGSVVIKEFGILNPLPELALGPEKDDPDLQAQLRKYVSPSPRVNPNMVGIAFPGTFIVDSQGRVKERFFEDYYVERNTASNLMIKLGERTDAAVAGTKISTAHLEINTYPSNGAIAAGDRFSVVLDIQPHSKIHVYAPRGKRISRDLAEYRPRSATESSRYAVSCVGRLFFQASEGACTGVSGAVPAGTGIGSRRHAASSGYTSR